MLIIRTLKGQKIVVFYTNFWGVLDAEATSHMVSIREVRLGTTVPRGREGGLPTAHTNKGYIFTLGLSNLTVSHFVLRSISSINCKELEKIFRYWWQ